jgi:hypothetical protein
MRFMRNLFRKRNHKHSEDTKSHFGSGARETESADQSGLNSSGTATSRSRDHGRQFFMPNAFRLAEVWEHTTPGLGSRIEAYQKDGRFRTAMDELFEVLNHKPDDQEALFLAVLLLGGSRTQQLSASEPIPEEYTYDSRLDPIWVVCSKCEREWVPSSVHLSAGVRQMVITNPIGQQCQQCGFTLCRDCLEKRELGFGSAVYDDHCPYCHNEKLTFPVLPTGRRSKQMERQNKRVTDVVIFREGAVPPDEEYVRSLLGAVSPEVFADRPRIIAVPVFPWPDPPEYYTIAYLLSLADRDGIPQEAVKNAITRNVTDKDGVRSYVAKIYSI